MKLDTFFVDEPPLEFRYGQNAPHTTDGLSYYGPFDRGEPGSPGSINYGLVGAPGGIKSFAAWSRAMESPSAPQNGNDRLWPVWPGFSTVFDTPWPERPVMECSIDRDALLESANLKDEYARAYQVVEHYITALEQIRKRDEPVQVAICIVPDEIYQNCRPKSAVRDGTGTRPPSKVISERKAGQGDLFDEFEPEQYQLSTDFRRQLKARAMKFHLPIQIIRESTLRIAGTKKFGERDLTPLCDRMWNLGSALYYKCGGKPWRLASARDGVCYIGIAFRRTGSGSSRTACCAAQMFLDSGDGVVFVGETGRWYSPKEKACHLSKGAAKRLLEGVLKTYAEFDGKPLKEIFLHCRSTISKEEFEGFEAACPKGARIVGVRVRKERQEGVRFFRDGTRPVIRGTGVKISDHSCFLSAAGFVPRLATYDGFETPAPLRIDIQHGEAEIEQVAHDVLGLTKLNYNRCRFGESEPVTVGFSDAVGEILVSNPTVNNCLPQFKYYI